MASRRITLLAGAIGIVMVGALAPVAYADNVDSQVIDSNGAGIGGIRDVAVGESTTVKYWIDATNSGQSRGCDAADGSPAVVSIVAPSVVVATPGSLTFTACGSFETNTQSVSFKSDVPGTYDVFVSVADSSGDYNKTPATFKLRVGGGSTGGTDCDLVTAPAAPTITSTPPAPDGDNSWFVTVPTLAASSVTPGAAISWSTDGLTWTADAPVLGEGTTTVYARAESFPPSGVSCDAYTDGHAVFDVDTVAPEITLASKDPAPNGDGWNKSDVSVTWNCTDATSGVDTARSTLAETISDEGDPSSKTGICYDFAGHHDSDPQSARLDKTPPNLNVSGSAAGALNVCGAPNRPTFAPTDNLSGLDGTQGDSWSTPSTGSGVGTYTYTAHAQDLADNPASETRVYTVTYGGAVNPFLQPINTDGHSSRFKLGSTIPVKFTVSCSGAPLSGVVAKLYVAQGDKTPDPGVDEAISTAASTTGNLFRYDPTAGQYIFNLSTKLGYTNPGSSSALSFSPGTWTLTIGLDDGTWRTVAIQLLK